MSQSDDRERARLEESMRPFSLDANHGTNRKSVVFNKYFRFLRFLGAGATIIGVALTASGIIITTINASALRRQSLQQGAAAQIRMLIGEAPLVRAKELIDTAIMTKSGGMQVYDFRSNKLNSIEIPLKQIMNGLETTAGLSDAGAIDRNLVCRELASYYLSFAVGLLGVTQENEIVMSGTRILGDNRSNNERLFKNDDYRETRKVIGKWFGESPSWFKSTKYDEECDKVAPPLGLWDELKRWVNIKDS